MSDGFVASRFSSGQASPHYGVALQNNAESLPTGRQALCTQGLAVRHRLRNFKVGRPGREETTTKLEYPIGKTKTAYLF
jgi:hypothetical protein